MIRRATGLLLLALLLTGPVFAQPTPVPTERIDSLVTAYHDARLFNGAVLIGKGDSVAYARAVGDANMEWDVPNTPDTRFHVGSITKQFTAALVLKLVEEGRMSLDSTVATYWPGYPGPGDDKITIHHLLSHRAGIPNVTSFEDFDRIRRLEWEPDSLVARFANRTLDFAPGSQFAYSNSGYFLLGVIVEKATGIDYEDLLNNRILDPLGLSPDIGYAHDHRIIEREAAGYRQTVWGYRRAEFVDSSTPFSAGMLYASPEAMHRWTRLLHTGEVLPDSLYALMTTAHSDNGYGYGLVMEQDTVHGEPLSIIRHGGGINGFTTALSYVKQDDITIAVADNSMSGHTSRLSAGLQRVLYGGSPPPPQPSVARALWDVLQDRTVADATARYRTLQQEQPDAYEYGAAEVVRLGDALREKDQPEQAAGIYEFAISMDSTVADAHAGLGLAEKTLGNQDAATAHLKTALDLNKGHQAARQALRTMGVAVNTTAVELSPEILERYTGVYAAKQRPSFKITITRQGNKLYEKATGQSKYRIYPSSKTGFYMKVVDAQIEFTVQDESVPQLTLYQRGQEIVFERTDEQSK